MIMFVLGDFNVEVAGASKHDLASPTAPVEERRDAAGDLWNATLSGLTELHQPAMTRFDARWLREGRNDRVYTSMDWQLRGLSVNTWVARAPQFWFRA
eukprot:719316-Karenia_brevis.AAC.1